MQAEQTYQYKEEIAHTIENRPYSFHRSQTSSRENLVLYQHWHNEIELFFLEKGQVEFIVENQKFILNSGEAILIPPDLLHMALNHTNQECVFFAFVFSPSLITESYLNAQYTKFMQPLKLNGKQYICCLSEKIAWQKDILTFLKKIFGFYEKEDISSWELDLHGLLYQLWNLYYNHFMSKIEFSDSYGILYQKLEKSLSFIEKNYAEEITINQLAEKSGLCVGTFCRYFKQLTGMTAFSYLIWYRVRKSGELLCSSDMSITEAAGKCGFNNISHYNRCFFKIAKCRPSEYRKKIGEVSY